MAIKWSAARVSQALDRIEESVNQASGSLDEARIAVDEARGIANLPQYVEQHLWRILDRIGRVEQVQGAIQAARDSIPASELEVERARLRAGSQESLL